MRFASLASPQRRSRRFLPSDPRVEEPYRLTPQVALRIAILGALALTVFAVLFLRLWALQVLSGTHYRAQANGNRARTILLDAPRGQVVDAAGHHIVTNVLGTSLELWPADLPKSWPAERRELQSIASVVSVPMTDILSAMHSHQGDPLTPLVIRRALHDDQISYFEEHRLQYPGVQLADSYLRKYPFQSLAAHVVGYVGEITEQQLKAGRKYGYGLGDIVGQAGVELSFDRYLRGHPGKAQLTVDSRGRPTSSVTTTVLPQPGNTIRLTFDVNVQRAAERALRYGIKVAHSDGQLAADGGAIVALDPRSGAVLALASYPTYKPSVYVSRDPHKLAELQDAAVAAHHNYPGLDRALDVTYPPGSVWKPVTALAALEEHIIQPNQSLLCSGSFSAYGQVFKNWDTSVYQWMELPQALAESCDTYFYRVGLDFYKLPASQGHALQAWAARFGFGTSTGLDIGPETAGLVPTPEWRRKTFEGRPFTEIDRIWKPGYSIQLAIGQGDVNVTPIQMARFYALIANGGQLVKPHIVEDVEQASSDPRAPQILRQFGAQPPTPSGVDPAALQVVQTGLYDATHSKYGTSSGVFGTFPISIAGKTGTAEKLVTLSGYPHPVKLNQAWWCGYGPTGSASIVVCAVIENGGHGGVSAAPAALQVFKAYFKVHRPDVIVTRPSD